MQIVNECTYLSRLIDCISWLLRYAFISVKKVGLINDFTSIKYLNNL